MVSIPFLLGFAETPLRLSGLTRRARVWGGELTAPGIRDGRFAKRHPVKAQAAGGDVFSKALRTREGVKIACLAPLGALR
jgi:hypothetical protein